MTTVPRRALLLAAWAVLCCTTPSDGDQRSRPPDRLPTPTGKCIIVKTINHWRPLDRYRLLVFTTRENLVIEFNGYCPSLHFVDDLIFSSKDGRVCDFRMDELLVRDQSCSIGSIRPYKDPTQERLEGEIDAEEPED